MKRAELGTIFKYHGVLSEVIAINDGQRSLVIKPVGKRPCPQCGNDYSTDLIEASPLFQENAEPVQTLEGS